MPQINPVLRNISNLNNLERRNVLKPSDALNEFVNAKIKVCVSKENYDNFENIDEKDSSNPVVVSTYVNDVYEYLHSLELQFPIQEQYLNGRVVTPKMRELLVDWLIQVHKRFKLLQETLFLSIQIMDRFLQNNDIGKKHLQLVGITSLLLASKYEEQYSPKITDFIYISDNAYTAADIKRMERRMLTNLDISLGKPLCIHFLRRYSKVAKVDFTVHNLAKYLMELTVMDYELVHVFPSKIAAATLCLALILKTTTVWYLEMEDYVGYSFKELKSIIARIAQLQLKLKRSKYQTIKLKYSSSKFQNVSMSPLLSSQILEDCAKL